MAAATFETDLVELITQAAEAAAIVGSLWSSFKVVEQARDYYNLYKRQRDFYYSTFQQGAEAPLALEVYGTARVNTNYSAAANELYNTTGVFGGDMSDVMGWWERRGLMFGALPAETIASEEYASDRAALESHWNTVMYRFEEANVDILNDQRWDHRMKLHNVAMKQQSAVISGLASAEGQREDTLTATGSYLADVSGSLAQRRGILQGHKDAQARYAGMANSSAATYDTPATTFALGAQPQRALPTRQATPGVFENVR